MRMHLVPLSLALLTLSSANVAAQMPEPLVVEVNCDEGDDLAAAIRRAEAVRGGGGRCALNGMGGPGGLDCEAVVARPIVIGVRGSCQGPVEIRADNLTLRGLADGAEIVADLSAVENLPVVIRVDKAKDVLLENLGVSGIGGHGWVFYVTHSELMIRDCTLAGSAAFLMESDLSRVDFRYCQVDVQSLGSLRQSSFVFVRDSALGGGRFDLIGGSELWLQDTEATEASVLLSSARLNIVGSVELGGISGKHSRVDMREDPVKHTNPTVSVVSLSDDSFLWMSHTTVTEWVRLYLSRARIGRGTTDRIELHDFSRAVLDLVETDSLGCDATSDATCSYGGARVGSSTCGSCVVTAD